MDDRAHWTLRYPGLILLAAGTLAGVGIGTTAGGPLGAVIGGIFGCALTLTMVLAGDEQPEYGPHQ